MTGDGLTAAEAEAWANGARPMGYHRFPELPPRAVDNIGNAYWVDCPQHGAQPPHFTKKRVHRGYDRWDVVFNVSYLKRPADPTNEGALGPVDTLRAVCARCEPALPEPLDDKNPGGPWIASARPMPYAPLRIVKLRSDRSAAAPEECGTACLNGRKTCNCRCEGLCHGAGSCACGVPGAAAAHRAALARASRPAPAPPQPREAACAGCDGTEPGCVAAHREWGAVA